MAYFLPFTPSIITVSLFLVDLCTGSIDKMVIVWNLLSGEPLQTLVGHSDRVCFLHVYEPTQLLRSRRGSSSDASSGKMNFMYIHAIDAMHITLTADLSTNMLPQCHCIIHLNKDHLRPHSSILCFSAVAMTTSASSGKIPCTRQRPCRYEMP